MVCIGGIKSILAVVLGLTLWSAASHAATLRVDNSGTLLGATGVSIDGREYKVRLKDGSCDSVFFGCQEKLFAFRSADDARQAGFALLNQVYVDGAAGNFDTGFNIAGCSTGPGGCITRIPYADLGPNKYLMATVVNGAVNDFVVLEGPFTNDNGPFSNLNFAAFAPVPVPSGLPLLVGAIGALWAFQRRRAN